MEKVLNEQTGVEEMKFGGKLISISDKVLTNVNNKNYKVVTIEFEDVNGKEARCSALCYEGNYQHGVDLGETYLCVATPTEQGVIVKMSHLTYNGERATADMFGFETVKETSDPVKQANTSFESTQL